MSQDTQPSPRKKRILVAEDEAGIRDLMKEYLDSEGYDCTTAPNGQSAMEQLLQNDFDLLITDVRMPVLDGLGLLAWLQEKGPLIPAMVMSAYADVEAAVQAMKLGASDYLSKPFDLEELKIRLERSLKVHSLEQDRSRSARPGSSGSTDSYSKNPRMQELLDLAARSAPSDAGILIRGESGSGKEVLARWIHQHSLRREGNFVAINLGGIPEHLLESELFGHEKGAFTGADRRKAGLFELAHGGTLFLDEIGDMPLGLQVKILRVLQDKKIQRLGSVTPLPLDIRIMAATHVDLDEAVRKGLFREDLMYRLKIIELRIPPLRERPEDIPALAADFIARYRPGKNDRTISPAALDALMAYPFPGNIRELENMVQRALILARNSLLEPGDFGLPPASGAEGHAVAHNVPAPGPSVAAAPSHGFGPRPLAEIEHDAILEALERNGGHRINTAAELGISRRTLLNKLKEYGIEMQ